MSRKRFVISAIDPKFDTIPTKLKKSYIKKEITDYQKDDAYFLIYCKA